MYSHGISTLMLAEVIGMLDRPSSKRCRRALEGAVRLILNAQNVPKSAQHAGGWRYGPNNRDSDLSVTGWQLLALRAAKNVGCDVPAENIDRAVSYVKNCSVRGRRGFAYQPGGAPTPTRTGTSIIAASACSKSTESIGMRRRNISTVFCCAINMSTAVGRFPTVAKKVQDKSTAPAWPCWLWRSNISICRSINADRFGPQFRTCNHRLICVSTCRYDSPRVVLKYGL